MSCDMREIKDHVPIKSVIGALRLHHNGRKIRCWRPVHPDKHPFPWGLTSSVPVITPSFNHPLSGSPVGAMPIDGQSGSPRTASLLSSR